MRMTALIAWAALSAGCEQLGARIGNWLGERPPDPPPAVSPYVLLDRDAVEKAGIATAPFDEQPVETSLVTGGRVAFDDQRVSHVFSPVNGRVTKIDVDLGQRVAKNDHLATIVSPDLGTASSDVTKADAQLLAAEHNFTRKKALRASKAASDADYEAAQDAYRQALAEKARAVQKLALLDSGGTQVSQGYELLAPIDGEVIARMTNPGVDVAGQYSNSGNAQELFTIGELDQVWVLADVYEDDIARVSEGAAVSVTSLARPGKTFEGSVDWISGSLDPTTRTARVRCTLKNPHRQLKPDMWTTVRIATPEKRAPAVPRSALVHIGEGQFVFVESGEEDGKSRYERMHVSADERVDGPFVPIVHGLLEKGMKVVVHGTEALTR